MEIDSGSEEDLSVKGRLHTVPSAADTTPSPERTDEQVPDEARVGAQEGLGTISVINGAQRGAAWLRMRGLNSGCDRIRTVMYV